MHTSKREHDQVILIIPTRHRQRALRPRLPTARGKRIRAADQAKDEFLAMLGHELRNPLSAITASAHVLRLSRPDAATLKVHGVIERQAGQMSRCSCRSSASVCCLPSRWTAG